MTDDRLYPPAAVYLTGPLARSHRQPRVEGLEGFVWFDVPHPDGTTYMLPVPEDLLQPAMPPEPEPGPWQVGDVVAHRIPMTEGGCTRADGDDWFVPAFAVEGDVRCWLTWGALWKAAGYPTADKIRPLVPAQSTVDAPEHDDGPIPFPGEELATRLPGGGWVFSGGLSGRGPLPRAAKVAPRAEWCAETARGSIGYICSVDRRSVHPETPDGKRWHVATTEEGWAVAVWPSSVVAVQHPGSGAS